MKECQGFEKSCSKSGVRKYRYGYQGKYAEKDDETGWNHFELREYDPVIGRWYQVDPKGEFHSPYVAMGNNPINNLDPDGGSTVKPKNPFTGIKDPNNFFKKALNLIKGFGFLNKAYRFRQSHPDIDVYYHTDADGVYTYASAGGGLWQFGNRESDLLAPSESDFVPGPQTVVSRGAKMGLNTLRRAAVRQAWKDEVQLVLKTGQGTRQWTRSEIKELLSRGKVRGYFGHHINSVAGSPQLAGVADNIEFLKWSEHFNAHWGNWSNKTFGELLKRSDLIKK